MYDTNDTVLDALLIALDSNPDDENLLIHIAWHLGQKGHNQQSLTYFQKVLLTHPVDSDALEGVINAATKM